MSRAEEGLSASDLLAFLAPRGGQEYQVSLVTVTASAPRRRRAVAARPEPAGPPPRYHLTLRGDTVQATGPSGLTRQLTRTTFFEVFGTYRFEQVQPTGKLSDLGPLFGALT